jgi:nucleotide-binding universal stress UspA family protein
MTYTSTLPRPRLATGALAPDGPVLLATKPFNGLDAPLGVARGLADRQGCALHVVSVLEGSDSATTPTRVPALPARYYSDERTALGAQIRRELTGADDDQDGVQVDVLDGPAARTVVEAARDCDARLIVVGTGRHEPIGRFIYGERALQIIAIADRPVLVVPRQAVAEPPCVAVIAVDFSQASLRAAHAVLPMLAPGGRLVVVHVKPGMTSNEETVGWWNDVYERDCADHFAQFLRQLPKTPGVTFDSKFLRGDIVPTLLDYAAAQGAKLIACGRLGHSLVERVSVGSVSSALVRHATCPVLVAPQLPNDTAWR